MELTDILTHLGEEREEYYNAVAPPIMQASNFCFNDVASLRGMLKREFEHPFYTRGYNPTVGILRKKLAALESSEDALVFASGSAAIAAAVMSCIQGGDHVICIEKPYSWTNKLLNLLLSRYGIESTMVDGTDVANFEQAIRPNTKLIFLESPNSLTFEMQDLAAVAALAKQHNISTICDNSYATPLNQKPIELGVDISVHSASKYLAGHSDLVAGVLCASKERVSRILESEFMTLGGIISPNDAWLLMRGLRTIEIRVARSTETAFKVVEYLENHPKVEKVNFPFSKNNPQLELAKKQMKPCGGLFSVHFKASSIEEMENFSNSLKYFLIACSWGGYESLQFPICALHDSQNYDKQELPWNLVRFYVGLEDPNIIIIDFEQALEKMN
jgi:cystathionine beta-lyase/cystathionine gamma-synthase